MRDEVLYNNLRRQEPPMKLIDNLHRAPLIDEDTLTGYELRQRSKERPLVDSELRVLSCIAAGMTRQMTADALGVQMLTVQDQLKSARYVLHAKNTTHAACLAIRGGLIA